MFHKARVKLTIWYLVIIMIISLLFSAFIYSSINLELSRFEKMDIKVSEDNVQRVPSPAGKLYPHFGHINIQDIEDSRMRLLGSLGLINLIILVIAGTAGYFLAGRTLRPIKEMVDEQNQFVSDASHELRTPITSLRSEIEVVLRSKKLNLKQATDTLKSNLEEVDILQKLSDDLILLNQNKKINTLFFKQVSASDVIRDSISKVGKIAKAKKIKIKSNVKHNFVIGDYASLVQLFVILLDNAIKYSPEGTQIDLFSEISRNKLGISVLDKGSGINSKDLPHVFDRFYRAEKSRTKDGYGLGLSMAKKIVDQHSGTIGIESKDKKGTTVIVMLPLKKSKK